MERIEIKDEEEHVYKVVFETEMEIIASSEDEALEIANAKLKNCYFMHRIEKIG